MKRLLARPAIVAIAALLAFVLTAPSLAGGLAQDDWLQFLSVNPNPRLPVTQAAPWDLFVFERGERIEQRRLMDEGLRPWWMVPGLRMAFFRPLSSLTHFVDYRLAPSLPALAHLHSLIWFALAVAAVARLYRRLMGPIALAGGAALLYAVDDAHGLAVGWLANRNAIIATFFGALCIHAHDRWRSDGWRPGALLAPMLFAVGLCAGEAILGALAYLVAHVLFLDKRGRRGFVIAPYVLVVIVWRLIYQALGYGAWGSGFYIDPGREPGAFLIALVTRMPTLLVGQLALPPSELLLAIPGATRIALLALGVVFLIWIAVSLPRDPRTRFWLTGCVLAVIPMCATWPNDRLLFFPGIGAMALVASLIVGKRRVLAGALIATHVVIAPLLLPVRSLSFRVLFGGIQARAAATLPDDGDVVVINAPMFTAPVMGMALRGLAGKKMPHRTLVLSAGMAALSVTRIDDRTIDLHPDGGFLTDPMSVALRGPDFPMHVGDEVALAGVTATVLSVDAGRPLAARFHFDSPLQDGDRRWVMWRGSGFVPFALPRIGETIAVPALDPWQVTGAR